MPAKPRLLLWFAIPALALVALLYWPLAQGQTTPMGPPPGFDHAAMTITRADGKRLTFSIEVATTPQQQEYGLMFRKILPADHGMLFLSAADRDTVMWMKNTLIPLDMLFVTADGRIVKVTEAKPLDLTPLPSGRPVRAVIEIAGGEAARQGIRVGDMVSYEGVKAP